MGAIAIAGLYVSMCGLVMGVSMTPGQTLKKKEVIKKTDECQSVGRSSVVVSHVSEMRCGVSFFLCLLLIDYCCCDWVVCLTSSLECCLWNTIFFGCHVSYLGTLFLSL